MFHIIVKEIYDEQHDTDCTISDSQPYFIQ